MVWNHHQYQNIDDVVVHRQHASNAVATLFLSWKLIKKQQLNINQWIDIKMD
jgi:hypothetical protein